MCDSLTVYQIDSFRGHYTKPLQHSQLHYKNIQNKMVIYIYIYKQNSVSIQLYHIDTELSSVVTKNKVQSYVANGEAQWLRELFEKEKPVAELKKGFALSSLYYLSSVSFLYQVFRLQVFIYLCMDEHWCCSPNFLFSSYCNTFWLFVHSVPPLLFMSF